ncbi:MAG TPA: serine hydrolase domain-containing protein, partial [Thermoanaerobaculia bacterium]
MRRLLSLLSLVFAFAVAAQSSRGTPEMSFEGESVDAMIAAFMKEHAVDGMSVAIVQAPYITRATGYGIGDRERRTLVSHNTIFDIGQMKNAFTAVAILQLVESGELTINDELRAKLSDPSRYAELEALISLASGGSYEDFI